MIVVWIIVAILIGVGIGQLAGFMAVEFLMKPVLLIARLGATLLGAIVSWGRRLP